MSEENQDANQQSEESSNSDNQEAASQTPAEANSVEGLTEKAVPYDRFKQVIDQKNQLAQKLQELESRLDNRSNQEDEDRTYKKVVEKFKKRGLDDDAAQFMAETVAEIAAKEVEKRVKPVEKAVSAKEVQERFNNFASSHKDFQELEPVMYQLYNSLSPERQSLIAADPLGLEMLYYKAKESQVKNETESVYQKGVEDAYANKQKKSAIAGAKSGNAAPDGIPSREDIATMSDEEYLKKRDFILKNLGTIAEK